VHDRTTRAYVEYVRRMPRLGPDSRHETIALRVPRPNGPGTITARFTTPNAPIITPPPLVCVFPDGPWVPAEADDSRMPQSLAELGWAVLEIHPTCTVGWSGGPRRGRAGPDEAPSEDLATLRDYLDQEQTFTPRRVALVGVGYG